MRLIRVKLVLVNLNPINDTYIYSAGRVLCHFGIFGGIFLLYWCFAGKCIAQGVFVVKTCPKYDVKIVSSTESHDRCPATCRGTLVHTMNIYTKQWRNDCNGTKNYTHSFLHVEFTQ